MKRFIYNIIPLMIALFLMQGCKKDETTAGDTHITTYAAFDMKGDQYQTLVVGETYTEQGVTAKEGTNPLEVKIAGAVNTAKSGIYQLTYSAVNSDGFPGTINRFVAVLNSKPTGDLSGDYTLSTYTSTMTKLAPGFYKFSNIWGPATIPVYVLSSDAVNVVIPQWALSGYGPVIGTGVMTGNTLAFKVTLLGQSTAPNTARNWVKKLN